MEGGGGEGVCAGSEGVVVDLEGEGGMEGLAGEGVGLGLASLTTPAQCRS